MHLIETLNDNATILFAKARNRLTATVCRVCMIYTTYYVKISLLVCLL